MRKEDASDAFWRGYMYETYGESFVRYIDLSDRWATYIMGGEL